MTKYVILLLIFFSATEVFSMKRYCVINFKLNICNQDSDSIFNVYLLRQHVLMSDYLDKYLLIKKSGGFPIIPTIKHELIIGDSSKEIITLKKYFIITGDTKYIDTSSVFNYHLYDALVSYQKRMGFKITGKITQSLIADLNIPIENRIISLQSSIKRLNNLVTERTSEFILINIPDFTLYFIEKDTLVFSMKIIVGKPQNTTAIFNGKLKYIVVCPYWNIPKNILQKEVLPMVRYSASYLSSHNMEWYGSGIRQRPGHNNALGVLKFLFPNAYNIYMHDTPLKYLFNENERTFSHGCIRIADARKMALYLLREDKSWDSIKLENAIKRNKETYVTLKNSVPVYINYFTAWVDNYGKINFRKDVYHLN